MSELFGASDAAVQGLLREAYTAVSNGDPAQALRLVLALLHATGGQAAAAPALNRVLAQLTDNNQVNALQELTELFARAASLGGEEAPSQGTSVAGALNSGALPTTPSPIWGHAAAPVPAPAAAAGSDWGPSPGPTSHVDSMSCSGDDTMSSAGGGRAGSGVGGGQEAMSAWTGTSTLGAQSHAPILCETGREGFMECALQDGSSYVCCRCRGVVLISRRQQHEQYWCQGAGGGGQQIVRGSGEELEG